jgi:hypothetical protein
MPIPQVNDRIKEAPVVVLRAVFAGIGQILLTADKVRARATEQVWTPDRTPSQAPAGLTADRQTQEPLRNGTTRTESAVAGHAAVREAPASHPPATKGTPATKSAPATKATRPAKTAPAATTTPAAKTPPATKATRPAKTAPAATTTPAAKTPPATKATRPAKATPAAKATRPAKATPAATTRAAKATPEAKSAPEAKATPEAKSTTEAMATRATKPAETVPAPRTAETAPATEAPPLPGYDDLSLASLRARLRVLDAPAIRAILAYEKAHANREPVITMLERRLAKISAG